ncbi:hypothetical protein DPMN_189671 [Dreissena polymorpha]|uniref:Uncharacterized protein n=1 Tax=Dreissena polymorpha TaxID=45954 RepID=A0A9D4IB18_DREPO|nr:hypothetical protein DPMN_189671 [Dreissena polymorpha]
MSQHLYLNRWQPFKVCHNTCTSTEGSQLRYVATPVPQQMKPLKVCHNTCIPTDCSQLRYVTTPVPQQMAA